MGRTYEALMQAEKEKLEKPAAMDLDPSRIHPIPQKIGIPLRMVEEYYRMEHRISSRHPEKKSKVLVFVGPNGEEGNSTVLTHFGITMAFGGKRVLLVDMNLDRPSIHRSFNLPIEKGLVDLVLKKYSLEEIMKQTSFGNLQVITSGKNHSETSPVHPSPSLGLSLEKMRTKADWILIDAPPINASDDAIALAPMVDGVILVIKAEKTRWEVAQNARQRIESGKGKVIGVVLNERRFYIPGWLYQRLG